MSDPFSAFFSNLLNTQNIKIWGLFFQWALKHWAKNMGDGSPFPCYTKLPPPLPPTFIGLKLCKHIFKWPSIDWHEWFIKVFVCENFLFSIYIYISVEGDLLVLYKSELLICFFRKMEKKKTELITFQTRKMALPSRIFIY